MNPLDGYNLTNTSMVIHFSLNFDKFPDASPKVKDPEDIPFRQQNIILLQKIFT